MFKNWLKKHHILLILGIGGVVFFILFSYLNFFAPLRFNSPDETANFFFAKQLAEEGEIWYFEPANYYLEGLVHPRSVQAVDALLVPGGFLGLIVIFGYIGKIMGANLMIFLTPFFAVLAGWAWYGLIKKYFDKWVGLVSVFFAWLCPAWWYYTARSMFPNVLFTSLLMIGAYLALGRPFAERRDRMKLAKNWFMQNLDLWLAGLFLGLAVFVRPAEVFWIGAAMLVIILLNLKKINWPALIMFFAVMAIVLCPMFFLNNALYGSPLRTGYQAAISDVETDTAALGTAASDSWGAGMKNYLDYVLPFGFHPKNILNNFLNYHIYFNWWHALFWAAGLGLAAWRFFRKKLNFQQIQYIIIFGLVSFWLIVVYGSWNFFDNIDPTKITIGNSYLRYWLPSFVLATPIIALAGVALNKFLKTLSLKIVWLVFFFMLFSILGVWTCFYGEDEGLVHVRANLWRYESIAESVLELTPDDAIIITDRSDKIFFPYRRVVCGFENPDVQDALETMYFLAPLYYYGVTFPHEDLIRLNEDTFAPNNLQLRRLESFDNESLYIFDYIKDETSA